MHHLAVRAASTLTSYRLLLGLVRLRRPDVVSNISSSACGAIHYATRVLGMKA